MAKDQTPKKIKSAEVTLLIFVLLTMGLVVIDIITNIFTHWLGQ